MEEVECEYEFWPIEHPSEPLDEDRPLKCPISHSPSLTNRKDKTNLEREWKRAEEGKAAVGGVRKRHHKLTNDEGDRKTYFHYYPSAENATPLSLSTPP